jgi:hypothetical protein
MPSRAAQSTSSPFSTPLPSLFLDCVPFNIPFCFPFILFMTLGRARSATCPLRGWPPKSFATRSSLMLRATSGPLVRRSQCADLGVLLWEIFTNGEEPFGGLQLADVRDLLLRGERCVRHPPVVALRPVPISISPTMLWCFLPKTFPPCNVWRHRASDYVRVLGGDSAYVTCALCLGATQATDERRAGGPPRHGGGGGELRRDGKHLSCLAVAASQQVRCRSSSLCRTILSVADARYASLSVAAAATLRHKTPHHPLQEPMLEGAGMEMASLGPADDDEIA